MLVYDEAVHHLDRSGHMPELDQQSPFPFVRVARPLRFPTGTGAGQRGAARRDVAAFVHVREAGTEDTPLPLEVAEVSATGTFVASDLLLPVGAALELIFEMPDAAPIAVVGRVVRVQERGGRHGMGIRFEHMHPEARASLREFTSWS
jgi:hypothetical protein